MSSTFYAAFRHVELDNIGYGKRRVLKPPGGGSSDIFGGEGGAVLSPTRPASKNHLKSSLFAEPSSNTSPTTNGNPEPITNGTPNGSTNGHITPKGTKHVARNPVTGEGLGDKMYRNIRKREGRNPVTGEGYNAVDERDSPAIMNNQPKQRVPPGGYTTPLW